MEQKITLTASDSPSISHEQLAAKGHEFFKNAKPAKAQIMYVQALLLDPTNKRYKNALAECFPNVTYQKFNPDVKKAITLCLDDPDISYRKVSDAWLKQLLLNPKMAPISELFSCQNYENFKELVDIEKIIPLLNDDYFQSGLKKCLLMHIEFERLLTFIRRFYLLDAQQETKELTLPFLCALATKCFNNDYIFYLTIQEEERIENISNLENLSLEDAVITGCYSPLYKFSGAEEISIQAHKSNNPNIVDLVRIQIDEPLSEKNMAAKIEKFGSIQNKISGDVQAQYEAHPYPRWIACTRPKLNDLQLKQSINKDVLIAGCGTGQEVAHTSFRMPNASIDAVDLSRTSLGYACRKAQEQKITNVRFLHGDILNLKALNKTYDLILSSGVLHHMEDPSTGLQAISDILKPNGILIIALYSEIGRRYVAQCQKWVKDKEYNPTTKGMRQFRQDIMAMDDIDPLKKMAYVSDFYSASECRDLIFHVQEHRFTCLTIKEMIDSLDLSLLHISSRAINKKTQYLQQYPDDPKAVNLENWHEFEQQNPNTFTLMYDLVLGKREEHEIGELPNWIKLLGICKD